MSNWVERREFIPVSETPAEMPEGIAAKYYVRWHHTEDFMRSPRTM